jgi:hypothetical protein
MFFELFSLSGVKDLQAVGFTPIDQKGRKEVERPAEFEWNWQNWRREEKIYLLSEYKHHWTASNEQNERPHLGKRNEKMTR